MDFDKFNLFIEKNLLIDDKNAHLMIDIENEYDLKNKFKELDLVINSNLFGVYIPEDLKIVPRMFMLYVLYVSQNVEADFYDKEVKFINELKELSVFTAKKILEPNNLYSIDYAGTFAFNDLTYHMLKNNIIKETLGVLNSEGKNAFNFMEIGRFLEVNEDLFTTTEIKNLFLKNKYNDAFIFNIFKTPNFLLKLDNEDQKSILKHNSQSEHYISNIYNSRNSFQYMLKNFDFDQKVLPFFNNLFDTISASWKDQEIKDYYIYNTLNSMPEKNFIDSIDSKNQNSQRSILWCSLYLSFLDPILYGKELNKEEEKAIKHFLTNDLFLNAQDLIKMSAISRISKKINKIKDFEWPNDLKDDPLVSLILINNLSCEQLDSHEIKGITDRLSKHEVRDQKDLLLFLDSVSNKHNDSLKLIYDECRKIRINLNILPKTKNTDIEELGKIKDLINTPSNNAIIDLQDLNMQIDSIIFKEIDLKSKNQKKYRSRI